MNPADRGCDAHRNPKVMGSDVSGTVVALGTNTHTQAKQKPLPFRGVFAFAILGARGLFAKTAG